MRATLNTKVSSIGVVMVLDWDWISIILDPDVGRAFLIVVGILPSVAESFRLLEADPNVI